MYSRCCLAPDHRPRTISCCCLPTPACTRRARAERARQLAAALAGAGFKPQDRLGIYSGGWLSLYQRKTEKFFALRGVPLLGLMGCVG